MRDLVIAIVGIVAVALIWSGWRAFTATTPPLVKDLHETTYADDGYE